MELLIDAETSAMDLRESHPGKTLFEISRALSTRQSPALSAQEKSLVRDASLLECAVEKNEIMRLMLAHSLLSEAGADDVRQVAGRFPDLYAGLDAAKDPGAGKSFSYASWSPKSAPAPCGCARPRPCSMP